MTHQPLTALRRALTKIPSAIYYQKDRPLDQVPPIKFDPVAHQNLSAVLRLAVEVSAPPTGQARRHARFEMANQTAVYPGIPKTDVDPIEALILTLVFNDQPIFFDPDSPVHNLFAGSGTDAFFSIPKDKLTIALAGSPRISDGLRGFLDGEIAAFNAQCEANNLPFEGDLELDLDHEHAYHWETIVQDVVRRSETLDAVTVITTPTEVATLAEKMQAEIILITANAIVGKDLGAVVSDLADAVGVDTPWR